MCLSHVSSLSDTVQYMHYEVELAVVIGQRCRKVRAHDALAVVRGYTIANDVTVRDFVRNFYRPPVGDMPPQRAGSMPLLPALLEERPQTVI